MIKRVLSKGASFFANFIPTTNIILFHSFPDLSDNSYAMCRYLHLRGVDKKFKFVWLIEGNNEREPLRKILYNDEISAILVKRVSFKGILMFIRARYVFVSHGLFDLIKLRQHSDKVINLWHGMPLKLLGASEKRGMPSSTNFDYIVSSSKLYQKIMAEAFDTTLDKVLVTGQPRCDLLFERSDWFDSVGINKTLYDRIGIWLPTYRKSIIGDIRVDGDFNEHSVSFLNEVEMQNLDKFLCRHNILLLLKIHPMDALQNVSFDGFSNIIPIKPKEFHSQLYPLIGSCDFMLTDYSSVYIDYLILHRPIGFVINDLTSYQNSRGFYFENIEKALPGPILSDYDSLCAFLQAPVYRDADINYNDFSDNCSSERICSFLNL